jgi:PKD repeat protein
VLYAYEITGDSTFISSAVDCGDYMVDVMYVPDTGSSLYGDGDPRFATYDALFLEELTQVTGNSKYADCAQDYFWNELTAGTYGPTSDWDATDYGTYIVNARSASYDIAPWDIAGSAVGAAVGGETAIATDLMGTILYGLEMITTTSGNYYDTIGLAGAIWASAATGIDLDPAAGEFEFSADSTSDLANLFAAMVTDASPKGWLWDSAADPSDYTNGDTQTTAYALMALSLFDYNTYESEICEGMAFIKALQQGDGQYLAYSTASPSASGGVEVHSEAIVGLNNAGRVINLDTDEVFCTIQAAIDDAETLDGHTIEVSPVSLAGARVYKQLTITGSTSGTTIIDSGVHYGGGASLTTAFHLDSGSDGTEIRDFTINCDQSSSFYFAVFSRGIDDVIIDSLVINDAVQGITNWGGINWEITNNELHDTVAAGGGGIGIFLGALPPLYRDCSGNLVQYNTIYADGTESGYTAPGICLCIDVRWSYGDLDGSEEVTNNQILDNIIQGTGNANEVGIEVGVIGVSGDPTKIAFTMGMIHDNLIMGNSVDGSDYGIYAYVVESLSIEENEVLNCVTHGISIWDDFTGNINCNDIVGNSDGLYNDVPTTIDATCNWWGDCSGPSGEGPGIGDSVSTNVDFDPWVGKIFADAGGPYTIEDVPTVHFDGSGSSTPGCCSEIVTYAWDFGDGHTSIEQNPYHTYDHHGSYTVTLTVSTETLDNTCSDINTTSVFTFNDPPIVQLIYPTGGEILEGTVTIEWFAIDDDYPQGIGIPIYLYYRPAEGNQYDWRQINDVLTNNVDEMHGNYQWDTNSLSDGSYMVQIEALDNSGNIAYDTSEPFTIGNGNAGVTVADVRILDITIDSPHWVKDGDIVEITAAITGNDAGDLTIEDLSADLSGLGGSVAHPDSFDGFLATWTITDVVCAQSDGMITITVSIADTFSNSAIITADNTAPELTLIKPGKGLYLGNLRLFPFGKTIIIGASEIKIDSQDVSGIDRAEYYIDGVLLETTNADPFNWHMNIRAKGAHNLEVKIYDCAGNTMTIAKQITIYNLRGTIW